MLYGTYVVRTRLAKTKTDGHIHISHHVLGPRTPQFGNMYLFLLRLPISTKLYYLYRISHHMRYDRAHPCPPFIKIATVS